MWKNKLSKRGLLVVCLFCILLTLSCTCAPIKTIIDEFKPSDTPEPSATATKVIPTNTPTAKPHTATPTSKATEISVILTEAFAEEADAGTREWSLPAYPGAEMYLSDLDDDSEYNDIVAKHARNLSIEPPYYYEFYTLPSGLRYDDIRGFFKEELPALGYKQAADFQGDAEIYLLTFVNSGGSTSRKIVIQYWHAYDLLMIIYKNPD